MPILDIELVLDAGSAAGPGRQAFGGRLLSS